MSVIRFPVERTRREEPLDLRAALAEAQRELDREREPWRAWSPPILSDLAAGREEQT